ncbi:MAG: hypothetical protein J6O24_01320 [Succinivibrio sp.]|nr:hypothetical protein [Succinivibrio sp.]MDY6261558.1 type IV secretion system protein [Succinivibrio sp.]
MKFLSKKDKGAVSSHNVQTRTAELNWETSRIELVEASERRAWGIVKIVSFAVVALSIAIICLFPLKTTEPYVIQVDKSTGLTDILHIANAQDIPVSEVMDKFWINTFVLSRESYDWNMLNDLIEKVRQLSLPIVYDTYAQQFMKTGKQDPLDDKLKDNFRIVVNVKSVVINRGRENVATVRFSKTTINNANGSTVGTNNWTANISFDYYPDFDTSEATRLVNPFGFKVLSYQVDPELN